MGKATSTIRRIFGRSTFTERWRLAQVRVGSMLINWNKSGNQEIRKSDGKNSHEAQDKRVRSAAWQLLGRFFYQGS
jgi:hypothetical protein